MNKHQADATRRAMEAAGYSVTTPQQHKRGVYTVDAVAPDGAQVTIVEPGQWHAIVSAMIDAPQPKAGARRKYGEDTEQHSVTLPASLWRWVEELGDGNRSAGTAKGLLAALNGEREGAG